MKIATRRWIVRDEDDAHRTVPADDAEEAAVQAAEEWFDDGAFETTPTELTFYVRREHAPRETEVEVRVTADWSPTFFARLA